MNVKPTDADKAALKQATSGDPRGSAIPVAMLRLCDDAPDVPGRGGIPSITATPREQVINAQGERISKVRCWVIDYLPAIRHHRVVYYSDKRDEEPMVRMIWEGHVSSWEPLAL